MASRSPNLRRLLTILETRAPVVVEEITERIQRELTEVRAVEDPEFLRLVHESSTANMAAGLRILADSKRMPHTPPADVGAAARAAANAGVSLATVLRAYRIAHAVCWREWMRGTDELDLPPRERTALLEQGSEFLFEFVDHVSALVTETYGREREMFLRSIEQRRLRIVRDLIDGVQGDATDLEYDLGLEHVGVVAWGAEAEAAVGQLGHRLERRILLVAASDETTWAWLGARSPLSGAELRLIERFQPPPGTFLALGDPARGLRGFRETHRQARDAQRVALPLGMPLTRYDQVALEALAIRDERYARAFVARELAPLAGDDERSRRLRETLCAYFATGQNAAAAAARLGVHDQTVSYRLRTIERRLGRPVHSRRAELELALRLDAYLRSAPDAGGTPEMRRSAPRHPELKRS
jgi:hypothetical protein